MLKKGITGFLAVLLPACNPARPAVEPPALKEMTVEVTEIDEFGDAILNITPDDLVFEPGDSVSLSFSGGYTVDSIAVYPDFFGAGGQTILVATGDKTCFAGIDHNFAQDAGVKAGETVTITLEKSGGYKELLNAYNLQSAYERRAGQSEADYINARTIAYGTMKEGILYRGSQPFRAAKERMKLMDKYMEDHGINTVISLSDASDQRFVYEDMNAYVKNLLAKDHVIYAQLGTNYDDPDKMATLGKGLKRMIELEPPYLIHCLLGKDRTGIICGLLEALCGASGKEITEDYMNSFRYLHDMDMDQDHLPWQVYHAQMLDRFAMMGFPSDTFESENLEPYARKYLSACGLSDAETDRLKAILEGKEPPASE